MSRPIDGDNLTNNLKMNRLCILQECENDGAAVFDEVVDWIRLEPTLTQPNEWVSVDERLPEEKQRVIVRCEHVGTSVGWILWGNWMTDIGPGAGKVTHWMPLPKSPKEDE